MNSDISLTHDLASSSSSSSSSPMNRKRVRKGDEREPQQRKQQRLGDDRDSRHRTDDEEVDEEVGLKPLLPSSISQRSQSLGLSHRPQPTVSSMVSVVSVPQSRTESATTAAGDTTETTPQAETSTVTPSPSSTKPTSTQEEPQRRRARGGGLFGKLLLGTLHQFKQEESKKSDAVSHQTLASV